MLVRKSIRHISMFVIYAKYTIVIFLSYFVRETPLQFKEWAATSAMRYRDIGIIANEIFHKCFLFNS